MTNKTKAKKILTIGALVAITGCSTSEGYYSESNDKKIEQVDSFVVDNTPFLSEESVNEKKLGIFTNTETGVSTSEALEELERSGGDLSPMETPTIHFDFDSYKLSGGAIAIADKHISLLKQSNNIKVVIEGHTDKKGARAYNLKLGEKRALSVYDYMISKGVPESQMEVISFGEEQPSNKSDGETANKENRRTVYIYK